MNSHEPKYYRDIINNILQENIIPEPNKNEINKKHLERMIRQEQIPWIKHLKLVNDGWDDFPMMYIKIPLEDTMYHKSIIFKHISTGVRYLNYNGTVLCEVGSLNFNGVGKITYNMRNEDIANKARSIASDLNLANNLPNYGSQWKWWTGLDDSIYWTPDRYLWRITVEMSTKDKEQIQSIIKILYPDKLGL